MTEQGSGGVIKTIHRKDADHEMPWFSVRGETFYVMWNGTAYDVLDKKLVIVEAGFPTHKSIRENFQPQADRPPPSRLTEICLRAGDPCKVVGEKGLWKFIGASITHKGTVTVDLVGPMYDPYNPRTRSFNISMIQFVEQDEANRARVTTR